MNNCPICNHEIDFYYEVNSDEPFIVPVTHTMQGIEAYGAYFIPKTIICYRDDYVHFTMPRCNGCADDHRLVKLLGSPAYDTIDEAHEHHDQHRQTCQHSDCANQGIPLYINSYDIEPNEWFCWAHASDHGYCPSCRLLCAGIESFDFSETGLCYECEQELRYEMGEYDASDDDPDFD